MDILSLIWILVCYVYSARHVDIDVSGIYATPREKKFYTCVLEDITLGILQSVYEYLNYE